MTALTLLQLFPDELGVAGDRGNVLALTRRLGNAGHDVTVVAHEVGSTLPTEPDLVIVGNGPLSAMRNIYGDLVANGDALRALVASGVPLFAYGSGAELLGHRIALLDGSTIEGLGILPFTTTRVTTRKVGYIITDTSFGRLVGFEDNASQWTLDAGAQPLGTVLEGGGNGAGTDGSGGGEGVIAGSAMGTQVGGPVLPLNPVLTDALIATIAARRGFTEASDAALVSANDDLDLYASRARDVMLANAKHVFSRI